MIQRGNTEAPRCHRPWNFSRDIEWTLEYNDLNQLTKRFVGASWSVGTHRIEYDYDDNGNLIGSVEETYGGVWSVSEEWQYDWNPRDQMTRAKKWAGSSGSTNNVGSVEYQYCLACDGALSKRFVYAGGSGASRGALQSGQRYEYDGLNLLRVDEIYGSTLSESGPWRKVEISTHQPGQLGALLHKRVYKYSSATSGTPSETKDFTYSYDPVGNVYSVFDGSGNEAYYFTQDAFGNKLPIATLGGSNWNSARADRIVEHQTGKWVDEFTGLYYFHARWMDAEVGRFVGRDIPRYNRNGNRLVGKPLYRYANNCPTYYFDPNGYDAVYFCTRKIADHPARSLINALGGRHCFLRLKDENATYDCGVNPTDGNPHPEPDDLSDLDVKCALLPISYDCMMNALKDQDLNRDNGARTPGFGGDYNSLSNNCCTGVWKTLSRCILPDVGNIPTTCNNCPIPSPYPGNEGPPTPPCRDQDNPQTGGGSS